MEPGSSLTIIHASDFHIKKGEDDVLSTENDIRKLFIFDAKNLVKKLGSPTAVVLSGDLAFKGEEEEYNVSKHFINRVLSDLGIEPQRLLIVPGNHDVNRDKTLALDARRARDDLRALPYAAAEKKFIDNREKFLEPIASFQEFSQAYDCLLQGLDGCWTIRNDDPDDTASEYLQCGFDLEVRGISTVNASDWNDDLVSRNGEQDYGWKMFVSRGQISCEPLTNEDNRFRIFIAHHPPGWWRFEDDLTGLLNARYHLQLFGHEHQFSPATKGNAVRVTAGAINPHEKDQFPRYNWINIRDNGDKFEIRIWSRVFDPHRQEFSEDQEWPAGSGYCVCKQLKDEPIAIAGAEIYERGHEKPDQMPKPDDEKAYVGVKTDLIDEADTEELKGERKELGHHAIRYALLSSGFPIYSKVFKRLGIIPSKDNRYRLIGLEYYESELVKILKSEKIDLLIEAMRSEGIDV